MMYRLIGLTGALKNQRITVEQEPMTIGRDAGCAVVVPDDKEMAREHARIEHRDDGLYIKDLGTMNKVLVNKREIRQTRLTHGDMIELGRTRFLVQAVMQAEMDSPAVVTPRRKQWRAIGAVVVSVLVAVVLVNRMVHRDVERETQVTEALPASVEPVPVDDSASVSQPVRIEMSEDLKLVREDLAAIRETMKSLTNQQPAIAPEGMPTGVMDDKIDMMFQDAEDQVARGRVARADQLFASIQLLDPEYLPAYEERAMLFERRGMLDEAIDQWSAVLDHDPNPDQFQYAVGERLRLSQRRQLSGKRDGQVEIASIEQHKVLAAGDYSEMRMLRVTLEPRSNDLILDAGSVRLEVEFFDEKMETGEVFPSSAVVEGRVFKNEEMWGDGQQRVFTSTYAVPKASVGDACYYGYRVRVFYNDEVQEIRARPKTLLESAANAEADQSTEGL